MTQSSKTNPEKIPSSADTEDPVSAFDFGAHGGIRVVRGDGAPVDLTTAQPASAYRLLTTNAYALNDAIAIDEVRAEGDNYRVRLTDYDYEVVVDRLGNPVTAPSNNIATRKQQNLYTLAPYYSKEEMAKYETTPLSDNLNHQAIRRVQFMRGDTLLNKDYGTADAVLVVFDNGQSEKLTLESAPSPHPSLHLFRAANGLPVMVGRPTEDMNDLVTRLTPIFSNVMYRNSKFRSTDYDELYLEESFETVKAQVKDWLNVMLQHTTQVADKEVLYRKIEQNKEKLMMAMAYLNRWYKFDIGSGNIATNSWQKLAVGQDALEFLLDLSKTAGKLYAINMVDTYKKVLAPLTKQDSLRDFLAFNRQVWLPNTSTNEWFKNTTKAYISEQASNSIAKKLEVFERLNHREFEKMYLPLLTLPERSVYVIPTHATLTVGSISGYVTNLNDTQAMANFIEMVDRNARAHRDHIDFWYRIAGSQVKDRLIDNTVKIRDSHLIGGTWDTTSLAARHFFKPIGEFHYRQNVDAFSDGKDITFYRNVLDKTGFENGSIWTHELVHALEDSIYLNGYGTRVTVGQENYAEGLLQSIRATTKDALAWNTYATISKDQKLFQHVNASPERFKNAQDLQEYTKRMLDVLYVLDYAEAQALVALPNYQKQNILKKMVLVKDMQDVQPGIASKNDQVLDFDGNELANLTSWQALVEANAVVYRSPFSDRVGLRQGPNAGRNAYHRISLYTPMFGLSENDQGASGGYTFRRTAFELLAYKGFLEGMVPYISNQYSGDATHDNEPLSDRYIVRKIFQGDKFDNLTDFKKAMFEERIGKLNRLKHVQHNNVTVNSADELLALFKEAYRKDMANSSANAVYRLRTQLYQAYFNETDGFSTSIFEN